MKSRCTTLPINSINYKYYRGKGVTMCDRWYDYDNFLKDMGERPQGMTLERIDPSKGYYKENCEWATPQKQAYNKSNTLYITYNNETKSVGEWSKITGIKTNVLRSRIKSNSTQETIFRPVDLSFGTGRRGK